MARIKEGTAPLAIVLGFNYIARLGVSRALGQMGCDVVVIATNEKYNFRNVIDSVSKYVVEYRTCPGLDDEALMNMILEYKLCRKHVFIIPTDDYPAYVVDKYLDRLKGDFYLPNIAMRQGAITEVMDKDVQKAIARQSGFDVAETWSLKYEDGDYRIPDDIKYPCFTKPQESYSAFLKQLMKRCDNRDELVSVIGEFKKQGYKLPILVEEFVNIEQEYVIDGLSLGGQSYHPATIEKGLIFRGVTATGKLVETKSLSEVSEKLDSFFRALNMTGLYDVELFYSDGKFYFNELNVRIGACGYAFIKEVANFPQMLVEYFVSQQLPVLPETCFAGKTFASEKACMQLLSYGHISLPKYWRIFRKADFSFINQREDLQPYKKYLKVEYTAYLKTVIKKLLHR